jgi:hypothetical protein
VDLGVPMKGQLIVLILAPFSDIWGQMGSFTQKRDIHHPYSTTYRKHPLNHGLFHSILSSISHTTPYTNEPPIVDWRVEIHRKKGIGWGGSWSSDEGGN